MRKFFTVLTIGIVALIAYTYGAKAGRGRYREIKAGIDAMWNDPRVKKLEKLLTSDEVKKFIEDTYDGSVIPSF